MAFFVGLDLGKKHDHTAIAVVERVDVARPYGEPELRGLEIRWLERVPLGTPYPVVVARVREIVRRVSLLDSCVLVVDGTGVGTPVVDLLRAAGLGCELTPVTITGGERSRQTGSEWSVPKMELIAGMQVLLDQGMLRIAADLRETGALVEELLDMKMRESGRGRVSAGADGAGEHDDLAVAVSLACWRAKRGVRGMVGTRRLNGI